MSAAIDPKVAARVCTECSGPLPTDVELFEPICDACLDAEHDRVMAEAKEFRQPAPAPIPVRARYYLTECRDCGWVGSSEQCDGDDESVVCPVCCSWHCEESPSEADTYKHGEAVMQRILAAEAERDAALKALALVAPLLDHLAGQEMSLALDGGGEVCSVQACEVVAGALGVEIGMSEWVEIVLTGKLPARPSSPTTGGAA